MNTSNIFGFEETEKMGLRKGVIYYFNDWIDEKIISILELCPLSFIQTDNYYKYAEENYIFKYYLHT